MIRFRINYRATEPPPECWDQVLAFVEGVTGERVGADDLPVREVKQQNEAGALVQVAVELADHGKPASAIEDDLRAAATAGEADLLLVESS